MIDEELYQLATKELNSEHRKPDLWARAVALASDDHDEARFLYTNLRVEELIVARDAGETLDIAGNDTAGIELVDDQQPVDVIEETMDSTVIPVTLETESLTHADQHQSLDLTDEATSSLQVEEPAAAKQSPTALSDVLQADEEPRTPVVDDQTIAPLADAYHPGSEAPLLEDSIPTKQTDQDPNFTYQHGVIETDADAVKMAPSNALSMDDSIRTASFLTEQTREPTPDPVNNSHLPTAPADMTIAEAQELHQSVLESSIETDQTVRLDHGPGTSTYDISSQELTTNQTLNPEEENDGDINPRIDLDELANQSGAEVETIAASGNRFYSVFEHNDGRRQAVKLGASWPAFFCTLPWLLYKKLWGTAIVYVALLAVMLVAFIALGLQFLDAGSALPMSTKLVAAGFALLAVVGMFYLPLRYGNRWVESRLERKGFSFATALAADTANQACQRVPH